jgi:hypothetical protein
MSIDDLIEVIGTQDSAPIWFSVKSGNIELGPQLKEAPTPFYKNMGSRSETRAQDRLHILLEYLKCS